MSRLELRPHYDRYYGTTDQYEVVETEPDTIAHTVYSIVAATLAAPLEKALEEHIDACPKCNGGWTFQCDECMRLTGLLPYRIVVIG